MIVGFDNTEFFIEQIREKAATSLLDAAAMLHSVVVRGLSTSYPPASVPGEFPHGRTWGGRSDITLHPSDPKEIARSGGLKVGFTENAWYIVYLEIYKQRLGIFSTFEQLQPAIEQALSGKESKLGASPMKNM